MEFKKKTIIWEDNNEPPKDYIWVKSDGKAYEYSYSQRKWIESESVSGKSGDSGDGENGNDSITMYNAWMKAFDSFKIEQSNNTILDIAPDLIYIPQDTDFNYMEEIYLETDNRIPIPFVSPGNKKCRYIKKVLDTENVKIFDIKNTPDDIYENDFYSVELLYDLDKLNEKTNISYCFSKIIKDGYIRLEYGITDYLTEVPLYQIGDKYYIHVPTSSDMG